MAREILTKRMFFFPLHSLSPLYQISSLTQKRVLGLEIHAKNLHWNSVNKIHRQHRTIFSPSYSWLISHLCNWGTRNIHPWCALNSHSHRWKPEPQGLLNILEFVNFNGMYMVVFISRHKWLKDTPTIKTGLLWLANKEWKRNCGLNILGKNIKFMILGNCFSR